jgi:ribosomal protein L40E
VVTIGSSFVLSGSALYLTVMLGIIAIICAASVPSLFFKKCAKCGRRNGIEASVCKRCGALFPETK